jgi:RNA polymerase sporulation-specific sigma factor
MCRGIVSTYFPPPGLDRDDLMQEARIGAWKAWRDFRGETGAPFGSFARMCIERQVITAIKTGTRRKHTPLSEALSFDAGLKADDDGTVGDVVLLSAAANPERRLLDRERFLEAVELLARDLSDLERAVFLAFEVDGLSYERIASALDLERKTIDNALQRARHKLDDLAADLACQVCGAVIDDGRLCSPCEGEIAFAQQFVAA